jgi:hypothetical protein
MWTCFLEFLSGSSFNKDSQNNHAYFGIYFTAVAIKFPVPGSCLAQHKFLRSWPSEYLQQNSLPKIGARVIKPQNVPVIQ